MKRPGSRHPYLERTVADLPFAMVNRRGSSGYDLDLQRHHLLPRQALSHRGLACMLRALGDAGVGFHDFRRNGILLPGRTRAALRLGLPLHRGPHRDYNAMVLERLGRIEATWSRRRWRDDHSARVEASIRIVLLQRALRRRILDGRRRVRFNRHDPRGQGLQFDLLDAPAEELWLSTAGAPRRQAATGAGTSKPLAQTAKSRFARSV